MAQFLQSDPGFPRGWITRVAEAILQGQGMHQGKVICRAVDASGKPCGESAIVHEVHYRYDASSPSFLGSMLTEISLDIECPRCGWRTQDDAASQADVLDA
jgi:hypothetical protein